MSSLKPFLLLATSVLAASWISSAQAQESLLELTHRGLDLSKLDASIHVDALDIRIDPNATLVKYKLTNTGSADVKLALALPFPVLDFSDPDVAYAIPGEDPVNFMGMTARLDGKAVSFSFSQIADLNGKNVSQTLRKANIGLVPVGHFQNQLAALTPEAREALENAGLLVQSGTDQDGNALYFPSWNVRTSATRTSTLAASKSTDVEIRVRTSLGSSPDTMLRRKLRSNPNLASELDRYKKTYCIDEGFYQGLDKVASTGEANTTKIRERRMAFDFGSGAAASIPDVHITLDKGRPDRLISFCLDNIKRIGPTTFEMRASDYAPTGELKVLLLGRD